VDLQLPHAGEEHARIVRIHGDVRAAGVLVDEQHAVPRSAAVGRSEDAALRLRAVRVAERAGEDDVGVLRVDDHARDAAGPIEAHARPRFAGVGRLVDAIADRDVASDECLAGAGPDRVRIAGRNRQRANRLDVLIVEDRIPVGAGVAGFPDAARGRADVEDVRIARNPGDRDHAIADGSDVPELQRLVCVGRETQRRLGDERAIGSGAEYAHEGRQDRRAARHQNPPGTRVL